MIIAYEKHITREITRTLRLPVSGDLPPLGTELATVGEVTYVHLPDGAELPAEQPAEIAASIRPVNLNLDNAQRDAIKAASPHVRLINQRVADKIAERYTTGDEIKLLRTAPSPEFDAYNAFVESCRAWGREQKAALGL